MNTELTTTSSCAMLLGTLLLQSPQTEGVSDAVHGLLEMDLEIDWPYCSPEELKDIATLLRSARKHSFHELDRDFHHLFVGPLQMDVPPWGSVYLDSERVVFGDSCIALTRWMNKNGIALHEGESREPVDHIGRMLILLGWICENEPSLVDEYLQVHLLTWAPQYFVGLEKASQNPFYKGVARLARCTLRDISSQRELPSWN